MITSVATPQNCRKTLVLCSYLGFLKITGGSFSLKFSEPKNCQFELFSLKDRNQRTAGVAFRKDQKSKSHLFQFS
jgi:hypothetical protein